MCGIAGIVSTQRPDAELATRMCDIMVHRGPDGAGYHTDERAALGMRRLAIIDTQGGDQPVYSEDRAVTAVFNGELYNFRELRAHLQDRGHRFTSDGDTECLVHLYEEYGDELVHRLRGMFAFAIWDTRQRRLLLGRDRAGKKPLYWRAEAGALTFASELKSLLQEPTMRRDLDPVALHQYLTYGYVPAPSSIYEGVQKLPPAHLLVWQYGRATVRRYWQLDATPQPVASAAAAEEELRQLLLEATRLRLVSERPVGALLSGGIDSSAVVAAMAQVGGERVRTFSVGFEQASHDERRYARAVAQRYDTEHHEVVVTPETVRSILPTLAWHFDEPFADSSAIPCFCVAQLSREHVTVVLTGDGGDEVFGGDRRYVAIAAARGLRIPGAPGRFAARLGSGLVVSSPEASRRRRAGRLLELLGQPVSHFFAQLMSFFTPEQLAALYTDEFAERIAGVDNHRFLEEAYTASRAGTAAGRCMEVDFSTYLPGDVLTKVDITSMANSLEARSPLLDHHLVEWAARLPTELKLRGRNAKDLFKRAVAPWLPAEGIDRPKVGFSIPLGSWLRTELRELSYDALTDSTARNRGLFRPRAVAALLRDHDNGHDHAPRIWALLQFELFHRMHLDDPRPQPPVLQLAQPAPG